MTMQEIIAAGQAKTEAMGLRLKPGEKRPPGFLKRAASFARAAARHVAAGLPMVSDEEKERRLAICRGCPNFTPQETCARCGCQLKTKASWGLERCPVGLW